MIIRIIVGLVFLAILYCLGSAFYQLVRPKSDSRAMAKSLAWRSGLSIALIIFLVICFSFGWIQPHGVIGTAVAVGS